MKALWAFEPFHQDKSRLQSMHRTLNQLVGTPTAIEVGFVVTRSESSLTLAFEVPERERFSSYPRKLIQQELDQAKIGIKNTNIHVIDYPTLSQTKSVDRLLKLAAERKVDLVALFTHARAGYLRFAMGSFAETAIHRSKISLLLMNPQTEVARKIERVLFASDFSPAAKKHLKTVIAYCKQMKCKLTVFHHAEIIYRWSLDETNPKVRAYRRKANRTMHAIEQECRKGGVPCEIIMATDFKETADLILKNAKDKKIDLVAVCAKSGPLATLMGGSITRQIVRRSNVPVLVLK